MFLKNSYNVNMSIQLKKRSHIVGSKCLYEGRNILVVENNFVLEVWKSSRSGRETRDVRGARSPQRFKLLENASLL
jgi:hypothetical protein